MKNISKKKFYFFSFTLGLPMSIFGTLAFLFFKIIRRDIKKYGHAYYVEFGKGTSGLELGWFFIVNKGASDFVKKHELGHAYQNAVLYGWLMPFIVCIPSFTRWCYRKIRAKIGKPCKSGYYDIWFEKEANEIGAEVMGV